ncbi:glycosyltransferase [Flavobacterium ovatum]|uniref:glycosyltransferase n=1 Tax=Flavobacterium ovatum TaxID=1928857 RepID=UPI00344E0457
MELQENRIAMVSPSLNAYSESFIQAQKVGLQGKVFYYYGDFLPQYLEEYGRLPSKHASWEVKIKRKLGFKTFNIEETAFIHSLKKNKIQVVLAQYGPTANRIVKICKKLNIPLITHFHGYDASIGYVIESCNKYKEVFEYSNYVIAVSRSMQKSLIELGCPSEKVIYNTYGPDNSFLNVDPQFTENTFIGLGRFVEKKAPYYTILAFKKVIGQFPNAQLVIGGKGELYEVCRNLVRYHKIENNVLLPGVLTKEAFIAYLEKSLAFVQHSVTALNGDQEGTPVSILEACAAGLPVIATDHAGIPDVIIDGETGFLVQEHDVDAMAEKMKIIIENTSLAKQMGANGKEVIKRNFSLQKHLTIIDDLVEQSIKG